MQNGVVYTRKSKLDGIDEKNELPINPKMYALIRQIYERGLVLKTNY